MYALAELVAEAEAVPEITRTMRRAISLSSMNYDSDYEARPSSPVRSPGRGRSTIRLVPGDSPASADRRDRLRASGQEVYSASRSEPRGVSERNLSTVAVCGSASASASGSGDGKEKGKEKEMEERKLTPQQSRLTGGVPTRTPRCAMGRLRHLHGCERDHWLGACYVGEGEEGIGRVRFKGDSSAGNPVKSQERVEMQAVDRPEQEGTRRDPPREDTRKSPGWIRLVEESELDFELEEEMSLEDSMNAVWRMYSNI